MEILKQSVGIDISKDTFTACLCKVDIEGNVSYSDVVTFKNNKTGFNQLLRWSRKQCLASIGTSFLMEATGVYYENLAYHLYKLKQTVIVVVPNKSKHYFMSLNIKTKTDKMDAKILSRFGVERKHESWDPPKPIYRELRNLTRYYVQLHEQKTAINNIKHSKEASYDAQKMVLQSTKKIISELDKHIAKIKKEIHKLIKSDQELKIKVYNLATIKGVGVHTVACVVAETNGFELIRNVKQIVSFAGYDVVYNESGTSVKGKTRISKKGNRYIRNALYFPAISATQHNKKYKNFYERVIQNKASKMVGQVAVQRKLLVLMYALWRDNSTFDEHYKKVTPETSRELRGITSEEASISCK